MQKILILLFTAFFSLFGIHKPLTAHLETTNHVHQILPNELKWVKDPSLQKDIEVALLFGNPNKEGPLVLRLKIPAGSKIAPHWHYVDENITVLSGSVNVGSGDHFDRTNGQNLPQGSFV